MTTREGMDELAGIEWELTAWEMDVARIITEIPSGRLTTYGCLARISGKRHGHSPSAARAVGRLRDKLYTLLDYKTTRVPLHRIASQGDLWSKNDEPETKLENDRRRDREGTMRKSDPWWCPCDD